MYLWLMKGYFCLENVINHQDNYFLFFRYWDFKNIN